MEITNIKSKLDFMALNRIHLIEFVDGPFCREREFTLTYGLDGPEEYLELKHENEVLCRSYSRSQFEREVAELWLDW